MLRLRKPRLMQHFLPMTSLTTNQRTGMTKINQSSIHRLVQHLKISFQSGLWKFNFDHVQRSQRDHVKKNSLTCCTQCTSMCCTSSVYRTVLWQRDMCYIDQWICVVFRRKYTPNWESTLSGVFKIGAVFVVQLVLHGCV